MRTPEADVDVTPALVRALLRDQHPDLATLPITPVTNGWDNALLSLGEDLCVRMPRRTAAAHLVLNEQRWLPEVATRVGVPVPAPLRVGRPGHGYPWSWSVNPWFPGRTAAEVGPSDRGALVAPLARFFSRLHTPAPPEAPENPVRGVPLRARHRRIVERLTGSTDPHAPALLDLWHTLVDTPAWEGPALWLHGDPHPANILVDDDAALAAVLDFGDLTSGDPATDLGTAWMTFEAPDRARFRAHLDDLGGVDEHTWIRARAWAVIYASVLTTSTADHPLLAAIGDHTTAQVLRGD
ncbi:aminoglycoside phosphotransferase family protein [Nocardiopsis sp. MG754419]|uniref:aminoglycoside phosphotransferase family protein n=1 Tax=Nocardiopsis sp. MG754419 TaxID=2259865 RepID=UPI001BA7CEE1|nr:aminoglycoside phosphotransferase family protein [Nocardiopsis sp. MG754419]MBR8745088.1 phosphotransferase [Nocardiopsis sp. MG754419]